MTLELFIEISGWIFGFISCVIAIFQTISKRKYKQLNAKQSLEAGDYSNNIQIGGINSMRNPQAMPVVRSLVPPVP
jgi:hypothetical protein